MADPDFSTRMAEAKKRKQRKSTQKKVAVGAGLGLAGTAAVLGGTKTGRRMVKKAASAVTKGGEGAAKVVRNRAKKDDEFINPIAKAMGGQLYEARTVLTELDSRLDNHFEFDEKKKDNRVGRVVAGTLGSAALLAGGSMAGSMALKRRAKHLAKKRGGGAEIRKERHRQKTANRAQQRQDAQRMQIERGYADPLHDVTMFEDLPEEKKKMGVGKKLAVGVGATAAGAVTGHVLGRAVGKKIMDRQFKRRQSGAFRENRRGRGPVIDAVEASDPLVALTHLEAVMDERFNFEAA